MLNGVAHRFRQPRGRIDHSSARDRVKHPHRRRHLKAQPVVAVVLHPRDTARSVRHLGHVAGGVVGVGRDATLGIRDADQLVLGVVGVRRGLALRDLQLQTRHHRQQVLVLVVAVLRDLAVGHRLQPQQTVAGVLPGGGVAPRIRLGDELAFEVIGERARVLHRRRGRVAIVIDRRALDLNELAPRAVGVGGGATLGIRHARAVAHVVVAHRGGTRARRVGVQRRINRRQQPVVAVKHLRDRVPVPVRGDPDPVTHRVVGEERLAPRGVLQLHQAVVAVVGVERLVAAPVGAAEQIAKVVVAAVGVDALGIQRADVVAVEIVEKRGDLLLVRRHIRRRFRRVCPVQVNLPRQQVAVDVVGEARDISARIDLLHQVLLGIVGKPRDTAVRRGDRRELVERGVRVGGGVAGVVGTGEHVAACVVTETRGEQRLQCGLLRRREIGNQLARTRCVGVAQLRSQRPVVAAVAGHHPQTVAVRHREQVARRVVAVVRRPVRLVHHLRDRPVRAERVAHREAKRIRHCRGACTRARAARVQRKGVAETGRLALGIDHPAQHPRARRRYSQPRQRLVLETDYPSLKALRHAADCLRRRQLDALQVAIRVVEILGDMAHAVRHGGQPATRIGVADQHDTALVGHAGEATIGVVGVAEHMARVVRHLCDARGAVGVALEHPVGVLPARQAPLRIKAEPRLVRAHHRVTEQHSGAIAQHLQRLVGARTVGGNELARGRIQRVLEHRALAVAHLVAGTRPRADHTQRHRGRVAPSCVVEGATRGGGTA